MKLCDARNPAMVMDLYELTMSYGYFRHSDRDTRVAFDVFYRQNPDGGGYAIAAGLEQVIDYIEHLHFDKPDIDYLRSLNLFDEDFLAYLRDFSFKGDVYAFPEGTVMYPNEPVITIVAPMIDAQIVETSVLLHFSHQSLIATKTNRIVRAAKGRPVADMGARRAHNMDAAVYGARAAYIGGAAGTATVLAGQMFGIPVIGTMAHSWVMGFPTEFEAFKHYALTFPDNAVLLVDTYNVLRSGVPNAIRTAKEVLEPLGKRLKGIRIDSGDLAYLSKRCRQMLDGAGLSDCNIVVSNSLDEYTIASILNQGGEINSFGIGERLITSKDSPVFGGVYKLAAIIQGNQVIPKIKISENPGKITNPGLKQVYRVFNEEGYAVADLIANHDEVLDFSKPVPYVDPKTPWKQQAFERCHAVALQVPVFKDGKRVYELPSLADIRAYVSDQQTNRVWAEELRFVYPHQHYLAMTQSYYAMKMKLLNQHGKSSD